MDKALAFFGLNAGEKAVEGAFGCVKHWINGRNELAIEREKTKQHLIVGAVALGVTAIVAYAYDEFDIGAGDKHFHAARR